jgi:hypothetical protein
MAKKKKSTTYLTTNKLLVSYLMKQGYMYFKVGKDKRNHRKDIWLFEDSEDLRFYVDRFYENRKMM